MTILTKPSLTVKKIPLYHETSETDELTADGIVAKNTTIDTENSKRVGNSFNSGPSFKLPNGRNADPPHENQQKKKRSCFCACGCGFNVGAKKVKKAKVIEISVVPGPCKRRGVAILCFSITVFLLVLMGLITALQIYEQVNTETSQHNRYQGFCSIPLSRDLQMLESRKMPLRWKTADVGRMEPNIEVVSIMEDEDSDHLFDLLREVLDINIDESVEKISVNNNGHPVSFIHDFESNVTGIVDSERCFTMDMDPELVLQPELFLLGLQRGDQFDVSRVRSELRALLPPLARDSVGLDNCKDKPTYRLQKDTGVVIRKRSADAPPHDYMQFAGKRVQEIEISNLAELLEFEQDRKQQ